MIRDALLFGFPLMLAGLAAPIGFGATDLSRPDPSGLYLLLGRGSVLNHAVETHRLHEVGPVRAPLARMILVSSGGHSELSRWGYWLVPASRLAAPCGIGPEQVTQ